MKKKKIHAVAFVQRFRIIRWKKRLLTGDSIHFVYGSNDNQLFTKLTPGSVLWIISSIPNQEPELVAKIVIDKVYCRRSKKLGLPAKFVNQFKEFCWIAKGTDESAFFGHNHASKALLATKFENSKGEPFWINLNERIWRQEYGCKFQRPRKICTEYRNSNINEEDRVLNPLDILAQNSVRTVFLSWKWDDNSTEKPLEIASKLAENGFMVWLDLLALPKSKFSKDIVSDDKVLTKLLQYGYEHSQYLLAVGSKNYGTITKVKAEAEENYINWTEKEWCGDIAVSDKPKISFMSEPVVKTDKICVSKDQIIRATEPQAIVEDFLHKFKGLENKK